MPTGKFKKEDITLEFYHKEATYHSKITGCTTPIKIKHVYRAETSQRENIVVIVSDKGNHYLQGELTFD